MKKFAANWLQYAEIEVSDALAEKLKDEEFLRMCVRAHGCGDDESVVCLVAETLLAKKPLSGLGVGLSDDDARLGPGEPSSADRVAFPMY